MAFLSCNDHIIHYEYLPKEDAKTIVFVNSLGTNFDIWDKVVRHLRDEFAILRFDKRGHGKSEVPIGETTIQDYADDLLCLLDKLDIKKIYLVGLSIGGMISMLFTSLHPQKVVKLVLSDTAPIIGNEREWNARIRIIEGKGISFIATGIIESWFTSSFILENLKAAKAYQDMLEKTTTEGYTAACGAIRDADLTEKLKQIKNQTLCICGSEDQSTPTALVKNMQKQMQNAMYREIVGTGHLPCVEAPLVFSNTISNFFNPNNS